MITIIRTTTLHPEFVKLIGKLDAELWQRYPDIQNQYEQHDEVGFLETAVLAFSNDLAVGCGCFKPFDASSAELKRMFLDKNCRGQGIAVQIIEALCSWAKELNYKAIVLETGVRQPEAIRLYEKSGFIRIKNYGPYVNMPESICMRKILTDSLP